METAALARCGRLSSEALARIVALEGLEEPAVAIHPLVARPSHQMPLPASSLERVVQLAPPAPVLDELLAVAPPQVVVEVAGRVPSPRLVQELGAIAREGSTTGERLCDARWVLLRVGDPQVRRDLVVALAGDVGFQVPSWDVLTWLAAAVSYPDLLPSLVGVVQKELQAPVARFAAVAAGGGAPVKGFALELGEWVDSGGLPDMDWAHVATPSFVPTWGYVVHRTGLEEVASAALAAGSEPNVWWQVVRHPRLTGGLAYQLARERLVEVMGCGPLPDAVVVDRAPLVTVAMSHPWELISWLAAGHDSAQDVAFAWASLQRIVKAAGQGAAPRFITDAAIAAAELACIDGVEGPVGQEASLWAEYLVGQVPEDTAQADNARFLLQMARVLQACGGVGDVPVDELRWTWEFLRAPSWIARLLGEFFAGVPGVDNGLFIEVLLDLSDQFEGTFADLAAVAVALAA